jgi:hypothetical protein
MILSDEMQEQEQQEQQQDDGQEMFMEQQQRRRSSKQKNFTINYRRQAIVDKVLQSLNRQVVMDPE